jgi:hypothetical protein
VTRALAALPKRYCRVGAGTAGDGAAFAGASGVAEPVGGFGGRSGEKSDRHAARMTTKKKLAILTVIGE